MSESSQSEFERDRRATLDIFRDMMGTSPVDVQSVPAEVAVTNSVVATEAIDTQKPLQQRGRRGVSRRKAHRGHVAGLDGAVQVAAPEPSTLTGALQTATIDTPPIVPASPEAVVTTTVAETPWTEERLLTEIVDGQSFTLVGPDGERDEYVRNGKRFDLKNGHGSVPPGLIVDELARIGWSLELEQKGVGVDVTRDQENVTEFPKVGEEFYFDPIDNGPRMKLVGIGSDVFALTFLHDNGRPGASNKITSNEFRHLAMKNGWRRSQSIPKVVDATSENNINDPESKISLNTVFLTPSSSSAPIQKVYRFSDITTEEFKVARVGEKWYRMKPFGGLENQAFTGEQMLGLAIDGGWMLLSTRDLAPEDLQSNEFDESEHLPIEVGRDPLQDIQTGDVWEKRRFDGMAEFRLVIDEVAKVKGKSFVYFDQLLPKEIKDQSELIESFRAKMETEGWICDYRKDLDLGKVAKRLFMRLPGPGEEITFRNDTEQIIIRGTVGGKGTVVYDIVASSTGNKVGTFLYDQVLTYLAQNQFSPIKKDEAMLEQPKQERVSTLTDLPEEANPLQYMTSDGKRVQIDWVREGVYRVSDVLQGTVLGELDEIGLRAQMTAERWRQVRTLIDTKRLQDIESLDTALAALKKELEMTRSDYVRIEMEESSVMRVIAQTFRQLRGKEEINPELSVLRAAYQHELTTIQDFEIRKLKALDLEGKALHEAIAGVVREYDFTETETLYELRRKYTPEDKRSLYEKSKALWEATRKKEEYFDEYAGFKTREYHDGWKFFVGATKLAAEAGWKTTKMAGEGYNRLNKRTWGKALTIGTGVVGGGILAFSSGGAAVAVAGLVITGKRMLGGIGLGLAANEAMKGYARQRREKQSLKKSEVFFEEEMTSDPEAQIERMLSGESERFSPEAYERLQAWLKRETVDTVAKKQTKLDRGVLYRQTGAALVGFAVAAGLGKIRDVIEHGRAAVPDLPMAAARATDVASASDQGVELPGAGTDDLSVEVAQPAAAAVSAPVGVTEVAHAQSIPRSEAGGTLTKSALLAEHKIVSGDTLWKYAIESGKGAGLDEKSQMRFATLLREKINEKLVTASMADIKAAGFETNKAGALTADYIQSGRTLRLGKLITSDELSRLMEQAKQPVEGVMSVNMPNTNLQDIVRIAPEATPSGLSGIQELTPSGRAADIALIQGAEAMKEAGVRLAVATPPMPIARAVETTVQAIALPERMATLGKGVSVVDYIRGLSQDEQGEIFRTMRRTVRDLLNTPETNIFGGSTTQYLFSDHPEFTRVSAVKVLADHATLQNGSLFFYDRDANPLHWTQMQEVARFSEVATKALGKEIGVPLRNESIEGYVLRITTVARGLGKTLAGYRMLN